MHMDVQQFQPLVVTELHRGGPRLGCETQLSTQLTTRTTVRANILHFYLYGKMICIPVDSTTPQNDEQIEIIVSWVFKVVLENEIEVE